MDMDYKSRKEAFVSGLSGGNIIEVGNVLLIPLVSIPDASALSFLLTWFRA